jgi:FG-GAP repeat
MRQRSQPAALLLPLLSVGLASLGCAKDVGTSFPVEVTALGNAASITVSLEWADGSETLDLTPDGKGLFTTQLGAGTGVLVRGPSDCRFSNGDNAIALTTSDETSKISLGCPAALDLVELGASLPVIQTQENLSFQLTLGALRVNPSPDVLLDPRTKYPGATVKINNASAPQRLRLGTNSVDVAYPGFGLTRSYTVTLTNAAREREHSRVPGPDASGQLGAVLAADGEVVAVAQPGLAESRVLVYRLGPTGWSLEATLRPETTLDGPNAGSGFGAALALSGDTLVVGAPLDDNGAPDVGSAYVFRRIGATWGLDARLTTLVPQSRFGAAVALGAGGLLAVGAPEEITSSGAVYVYTKDGITLNRKARLAASNGEGEDRFGKSIAFAGETAAEPVPRLLVGAPGEDGGTATPGADNSRTDSGAVYRFAFTTSWARDAYYKSQPMAVAGAGFGQRVAGSGDWLAMAWHSGTAGAIDCFSASSGFRYTISSTPPIEALAVDRGRIAIGQLQAGGAVKIAAQRLDPSSPVVMAPPFTSVTASGDDGFGRSLGFAGERLFVGASRQGATQPGAFYAFE